MAVKWIRKYLESYWKDNKMVIGSRSTIRGSFGISETIGSMAEVF